MNLSIKDIRSYILSAMYSSWSTQPKFTKSAVLAVLLSGHTKNGSQIFVARIFLNKERKQMGREEMLFLHFLIQSTESILLV